MPTKNTLYYGDNLTVLREYIATESVDLIYLDPPFNSSRSYNVLFRDESGKAKRVLVQVKGGGVKVGDIRDLNGTLQREKAEIGVFLTLEPPSKPMQTEAVTAGFYHSPWTGEDYPRIQILTIQELLGGAKVKMPPPSTATTFKRAEASKSDAESQMRLDL